ncbi:MAG: 50S ribosomal protein L11 methyltransferase [Rhodospirillales bacterium]|nr:50S ribosomal protein L11 methyltransferase [Rhodospirillales bacterium]MDH3792258.1 50S ribosomal protein L11 methyltransferase [Rhodospirillales bacterium]MDH3911607.1 50S ribosomal protein L11 methyltransferase [Rhodospirillales bacterium]MDH3919648.1 50S ribosomal protein L11 methyltransferase [Rhodospirillales bacterium]MDH3968734.1 50S ribosomal protein L11 methyltransferase [Rhodospirillales bacterium]
MSAPDPAAFIRANTAVGAAPLVPEIALHLASEVVPLWQATEADLARTGLPPPFWAFAWAGGQALARYLLDHPSVVAGKRVLDFAAGSGLAGIAAARAGAARVEAAEVDRFAAAAIGLNAALNGVALEVVEDDLVGIANPGWDLVLAGDVCYERPMAESVETWLKTLAAKGTEVLLGDPGRSYLPKAGLERVIAYSVKTSRELEDTDVRNAVVWRIGG